MFETVTDTLRSDPVDDLTRARLAERFAEVRKLEGALAAYKARLVTATNRLDDRGVDGAGMLRSVGRMSSRAASVAAKTAEALESLPATASSLAAGRITPEHASAVAAAAEKVSPDRADRDLVAEAEAAPADVFVKRSREWVSRNQTADAGEEAMARQRRERDFSHWVAPDTGMWMFLAELDPATGARAKARIDARTKTMWADDGGRDAGRDVRTAAQRGADAFAEFVLADSAQDDGSGRAAAPPVCSQLGVVADLQRLSDDPSGVAQLVVDGMPLPQSVLELLACNSAITPMLFNGPGQPLWVGRDYRAATVAQWKALIARDRGCVGCGAAPSRCEAHHVIAWADFGSTDITNLVLVCTRCHHDLHDRGSVLRRTDGRWEIVARAGPSSVRDPDARVSPDQLFLTA